MTINRYGVEYPPDYVPGSYGWHELELEQLAAISNSGDIQYKSPEWKDLWKQGFESYGTIETVDAWTVDEVVWFLACHIVRSEYHSCYDLSLLLPNPQVLSTREFAYKHRIEEDTWKYHYFYIKYGNEAYVPDDKEWINTPTIRSISDLGVCARNPDTAGAILWLEMPLPRR